MSSIPSIVTQPIIPPPIIPHAEPSSTVSSSTPDSETSDQSNDDKPHHGSVIRTTADYSVTVRQLYHGLPSCVRNIPTYVIQGLAERAENPHSKHPLRDATIGIVTENVVVEGLLARCIGATPAGYAALIGNLIGEPLKEALPSWEEIGQDLASNSYRQEVTASTTHTRTVADILTFSGSTSDEEEVAVSRAHTRALADILTLPHAAIHVISKLTQQGFDRFFGSTQRSSSNSSSSSFSSSSSVSSLSSPTALPEVDETISLGKLQERTLDVIYVRIVEAIEGDSTFVPPQLESVASSALSSLSISSDLEAHSDPLLEGESSRENKQSEWSRVEWTGVQAHVPLDNIKKMRLSTGVKFGQDGAYQTGISTTLSQPRKDLRVTGSMEIAPGVSAGGSISTRKPLKDSRVGVFSDSGLGISTSTGHPKDVHLHVPVLPLVGLTVPTGHPKETSLVVGVPGVPGLSVSLPVSKIAQAVNPVVRPIIIKPVEQSVKGVLKVFGIRRHKHRRRG